MFSLRVLCLHNQLPVCISVLCSTCKYRTPTTLHFAYITHYTALCPVKSVCTTDRRISILDFRLPLFLVSALDRNTLAIRTNRHVAATSRHRKNLHSTCQNIETRAVLLLLWCWTADNRASKADSSCCDQSPCFEAQRRGHDRICACDKHVGHMQAGLSLREYATQV